MQPPTPFSRISPQNPAQVVQSGHAPPNRGKGRDRMPSLTHCAIFVRRNRLRRGCYLPHSNPTSTIPRTRVTPAFLAADRLRFRDHIILASLLQQPLRVAVDAPGDHPRQQLQERQFHHPGNRIPGALGFEPRADSVPDAGIALGCGGEGCVVFHVYREHNHGTSHCQGTDTQIVNLFFQPACRPPRRVLVIVSPTTPRPAGASPSRANMMHIRSSSPGLTPQALT